MRTITDFKLTGVGSVVALSNDGRLFVGTDQQQGWDWRELPALPQEGFDPHATQSGAAANAATDFVKGLQESMGPLASMFGGMGVPGTIPTPEEAAAATCIISGCYSPHFGDASGRCVLHQHEQFAVIKPGVPLVPPQELCLVPVCADNNHNRQPCGRAMPCSRHLLF